jgi:hypothetical protein
VATRNRCYHVNEHGNANAKGESNGRQKRDVVGVFGFEAVNGLAGNDGTATDPYKQRRGDELGDESSNSISLGSVVLSRMIVKRGG